MSKQRVIGTFVCLVSFFQIVNGIDGDLLALPTLSSSFLLDTMSTPTGPMARMMRGRLNLARRKNKKNEIPQIADVNKERDQELDIFQWLGTYAEVVSLVKRKGFRTVNFTKFIQESLKAAVSHVDSHSSFFDNENYKSMMESTSGEFSGIGVSIMSKMPEDDALPIIDVISGGPAEKVGIKSGDKIVEVAGEKLRGLATDEVIAKLKGKAGTELLLKIVRNKKPLEFKVMRDMVKDQTSLCFYFKNQDVYYLSLKLFTENAAAQMSELLQKANEGKCKGIVLDLRRNPGGTLDSAIDMAGLFLPTGSKVVVTKDRQGRVVSEYVTTAEPILNKDVPIFILINNFTASAAEILAGCLRYHSQQSYELKDKHARRFMVFLLGTSTFGKGSVQELIPIRNGCALKLTTMLYFMPDDSSLQAVGIKPDFTIKPKLVPTEEMKWVQEFLGQESSLKSHITAAEVEKMNGKKSPEVTATLDDLIDHNKKDKDNKDDDKKDADKIDPDKLDPDKKDADKKEGDKKDEKNWAEKEREELALDVQVQASINMINMLNLARKHNTKIASSRLDALTFLQKSYLTDDPVQVEKIK